MRKIDFSTIKRPLVNTYKSGRLHIGNADECTYPEEFCKALLRVVILRDALSSVSTRFSNMYGKVAFIDKMLAIEKSLFSACLSFEDNIYNVFKEHGIDTSALTINCFDASKNEIIDKLNEIVEKEYNARLTQEEGKNESKI